MPDGSASPQVRNETAELEDPGSLRRMLEPNPVAACTGGAETGGVAYFRYDGDRFATSPSLDVPDGIRQAAQDLVWEIADWRLSTYLRRPGVRRSKRVRGRAAPFVYCGRLAFERWEGERPITVWWKLEQAVPRELWGELGVPGG